MLRAALLFLLATLSSGPARANQLMALVRADRWSEAAAMAAGLPDPLAGKLVAYFRLLSPSGANASEIAAFMAANPDWPQQAALARRRDEALAAEPDDMAALPLCGRAQSAPALERCAQADLRQGLDAAATAAARAAWLLLVPDRNAEAEFLRRWAPRLAEADHWQRFDRLMGDGADAAAQLPRLDPGDRLRAEARLALRHDEPRAASLLAALGPVERAKPAMLLEQARWLRRGGHDAEAAALWRAEDGAAEHAVAAARLPAFWTERNILARRRLRDGDAEAAYALAAGAAQIAPEQVAEAAFLAGWVALRRLADPRRAAAQFRLLARVSSSAITLARGQYWQARAAAAAGAAGCVTRADAAAAAWPSTYYGQLATLALDANPVALDARIRASRDPAASQAQAAGFATRELVRASAMLVAWGEKRRAAAFLLQIAEAAPEPANLALAAQLANGFGLPETAVALARLAGRDGAVLLETGWPVAADVPPGLQPGGGLRRAAWGARPVRRRRGAGRRGVQRRADPRRRVAERQRRPAPTRWRHAGLDRAGAVQRDPELRAAGDREPRRLPRQAGREAAASGAPLAGRPRLSSPAHAVASGGGIGFAPLAPGTLGSAAAVLFGRALLCGPYHALALALAVALVVPVGVWSIKRAGGAGDPGWVVVDEFAGQWVAMLALPGPGAIGCLLAFALFRLFDIAKPGPVGWVDRRHGAWAVMGDDLVAGGLAACCIVALRWALPGSVSV